MAAKGRGLPALWWKATRDFNARQVLGASATSISNDAIPTSVRGWEPKQTTKGIGQSTWYRGYGSGDKGKDEEESSSGQNDLGPSSENVSSDELSAKFEDQKLETTSSAPFEKVEESDKSAIETPKGSSSAGRSSTRRKFNTGRGRGTGIKSGFAKDILGSLSAEHDGLHPAFGENDEQELTRRFSALDEGSGSNLTKQVTRASAGRGRGRGRGRTAASDQAIGESPSEQSAGDDERSRSERGTSTKSTRRKHNFSSLGRGAGAGSGFAREMLGSGGSYSGPISKDQRDGFRRRGSGGGTADRKNFQQQNRLRSIQGSLLDNARQRGRTRGYDQNHGGRQSAVRWQRQQEGLKGDGEEYNVIAFTKEVLARGHPNLQFNFETNMDNFAEGGSEVPWEDDDVFNKHKADLMEIAGIESEEEWNQATENGLEDLKVAKEELLRAFPYLKYEKEKTAKQEADELDEMISGVSSDSVLHDHMLKALEVLKQSPGWTHQHRKRYLSTLLNKM